MAPFQRMEQEEGLPQFGTQEGRGYI